MEFILDSTMIFLVGVTVVIMAASSWDARQRGRQLPASQAQRRVA